MRREDKETARRYRPKSRLTDPLRAARTRDLSDRLERPRCCLRHSQGAIGCGSRHSPRIALRASSSSRLSSSSAGAYRLYHHAKPALTSSLLRLRPSGRMTSATVRRWGRIKAATCICSREFLRYCCIEVSSLGGAQVIYSRSAEYAIRAFVHLAQVPDGKFAMVRQIAAQEELPAHFLAKILQQLARKGLLRSSKGPTGGFSLRLSPDDISLLNIVEALDGLNEYQSCASGLAECNDEMPCGMHDSWKTLRSRIIEYLERTSIADLAEALEEKRRALEKTKPRRGRRSAGKRKRK